MIQAAISKIEEFGLSFYEKRFQTTQGLAQFVRYEYGPLMQLDLLVKSILNGESVWRN